MVLVVVVAAVVISYTVLINLFYFRRLLAPVIVSLFLVNTAPNYW